MEDLCKRVPLISKIIIEELDNHSLVNFKDASREITKELRNTRYFWIRVLRTYSCCNGDFKKFWAKIVEKTPPEFVKDIVMLIDRFSKDTYSKKCKKRRTGFLPQHIASMYGESQLYKHFVERTTEVNPKEAFSDITPLHVAACHGKLVI